MPENQQPSDNKKYVRQGRNFVLMEDKGAYSDYTPTSKVTLSLNAPPQGAVEKEQARKPADPGREI